MTAITFVALGTSLPDTFASMAAAIGDKYADASVGNVTGSNSVNVFLGLGLPWLIAAIAWVNPSADDTAKWEAKYPLSKFPNLGPGKVGFAVPAGSLGISVAVFCICATMTLGTLVARRKMFGYELGSEKKMETAMFFCFLWFVYVLVSALVSYKAI